MVCVKSTNMLQSLFFLFFFFLLALKAACVFPATFLKTHWIKSRHALRAHKALHLLISLP